MAQPRPRQESPLDLFDIITAPYDALNWVTDLLFVTVNRLFQEFGTPIVFISALVEATIALGVVFPGVLMMFLGGAAASQGNASVLVVFSAAVLGTMIGDTVSYAAGRWGGDRLQRTRLGGSLRMGAQLMTGRARWLIPFYHLHSVTRAVGPFGSGALRIPVRVWAPLDYLGAVIANAVWVGGGFLLGTAVLTEDGKLEEHPAIRLGLAAAATAWFLVMRETMQRRIRSIREREAREAEARAALDLDAPESPESPGAGAAAPVEVAD
ncbi:MAG: DedA family protein [Dehalococcoidia bacterium]|nr:DedA family protein [Dehalococcoidia bacterium]